MKRLRLLAAIGLFTITATAQTSTPKDDSKDLWSRSVDADMGADWRDKTIRVEGKGTLTVVDFFRAYAKAYPCDYHRLLLMAIDGDEEVKFNHEKAKVYTDKDQCLLENQLFAMRVFYERNVPVAVGVICLKPITVEVREAYYYAYNAATHTMKPLVQGSDFTGGIIKRTTNFYPGKENNTVEMSHRWGRCQLTSTLEWRNGKFVLVDPTHADLPVQNRENIVLEMLSQTLNVHQIEIRERRAQQEDVPGGESALPICIAYVDKETNGNYAAARAMEGFYYFYVRGWEEGDGSMLLAVYTQCAPNEDLEIERNGENRNLKRTPHVLTEGDEVSLNFYLYDGSQTFRYLDPASKQFAEMVDKDMPNLQHNEWRCTISSANEELVFENEKNGEKKVYRWNGKMLVSQ